MPFGNAVGEGFNNGLIIKFIVGAAPNPQVELAESAGTGYVIFHLNNAGYLDPDMFAKFVASIPQLDIFGPASITAGIQDAAGLEFIANPGGGGSASLNFVYIDGNGVARLPALVSDAGFSIFNGSINAVLPGTGTSPTNSAQPESAHAASLPGGWTGGILYRLRPDGIVSLGGLITTPAAGNYNGITLCTLPTGYRPTTGTKFLCAAVTCNFRIYRLDLTVPKSDLTAVTIQ
jgi:hypothetical protein